jgi:imidazolonepropionase-like amidohydrolase
MLALWFGAALAQAPVPPTEAWVGARIYPASGPVIADGVLLVAGGKIVGVGDSATTQIPAGATQHDVHGKVVIPGIATPTATSARSGRPT